MEPSILPEFVVLSRPLEQLSSQMQQKVETKFLNNLHHGSWHGNHLELIL